MARSSHSALFRAVASLSALAAVGIGAWMALQGSRNPMQQLWATTTAADAGRTVRVIAARTADGGVRPVATVIARDGGARDGSVATRWPPALLNPEAHLRTAWDLALGRPNAREVLFTFDDGPNPGTTDRLLPILDRHGVKAVFFVCGWRLSTSEEPLRTRARNLLLETFRRGHVIGNHTVSHPNMANLSRDRTVREIEHNADLIEEIIGQRPHLFRPPYGSYSEDMQRHLHTKGYELSLWSVDSHDWQMVGDAQGVAMNVIRLLGNMAGGTVLLHDTHAWSVRAADMILRWIATENRDRERTHRMPYRIVNAAEFIEGARERLPLIQAARSAAERHGRGTTDRDATANGDANASAHQGISGMGGGESDAALAPSGQVRTEDASARAHDD